MMAQQGYRPRRVSESNSGGQTEKTDPDGQVPVKKLEAKKQSKFLVGLNPQHVDSLHGISPQKSEHVLSKEEQNNFIIYEAAMHDVENLLYINLVCGKVAFKALVDTGATQSAIPLSRVEEMERKAPGCILAWREPKYDKVRLSSGTTIGIIGDVEIEYTMAANKLTERFLVPEKMNQAILRMTFFKWRK